MVLYSILAVWFSNGMGIDSTRRLHSGTPRKGNQGVPVPRRCPRALAAIELGRLCRALVLQQQGGGARSCLGGNRDNFYNVSGLLLAGVRQRQEDSRVALQGQPLLHA